MKEKLKHKVSGFQRPVSHLLWTSTTDADGVNNSVKIKLLKETHQLCFLFVRYLKEINQAQIKERPHKSALEESWTCTAVKSTGTILESWEPFLWGVA